MENLYQLKAASLAGQPSTTLQEQLTPRQLEVLALLCEGLPNKLIGRRLNIACGTVKIHVMQILRVLNVSSRLQAVVAVRSLGISYQSGDVKPMRRETVAAPRAETALRVTLGDRNKSRMRAMASDHSLAAA